MSSRRPILGQNAEISDMITNLSKKNNRLESMMTKMGTAADTADFRSNVAKVRAEGKELCHKILDTMKEADKPADRQGVDIFQKLSKQFQEQMKRHQRIEQDIARKEKQIVDVMASSVSANSAHLGDGGPQGSYQQLQDQDVAFTQYDLEEVRRRAEGIRQIERDVTELNEMFQDLQSLVVSQQDTIDSIENNIVDAKDQVVTGNDELVKAEHYQKQARKRQCCLLFLVLGIIVALVLAGVFIFKK